MARSAAGAVSGKGVGSINLGGSGAAPSEIEFGEQKMSAVYVGDKRVWYRPVQIASSGNDGKWMPGLEVGDWMLAITQLGGDGFTEFPPEWTTTPGYGGDGVLYGTRVGWQAFNGSNATWADFIDFEANFSTPIFLRGAKGIGGWAGKEIYPPPSDRFEMICPAVTLRDTSGKSTLIHMAIGLAYDSASRPLTFSDVPPGQNLAFEGTGYDENSGGWYPTRIVGVENATSGSETSIGFIEADNFDFLGVILLTFEVLYDDHGEAVNPQQSVDTPSSESSCR